VAQSVTQPGLAFGDPVISASYIHVLNRGGHDVTSPLDRL
jgi:hypothetical protein